MHSVTLMGEESLQSIEKAIVTALRQLKELEAPGLRMPFGPPGGPYRESAMAHLRSALREVQNALGYHRKEAAALHHVVQRPARHQGLGASTRG